MLSNNAYKKYHAQGNFEQTERLFATLIAEWGNVLDSAMIDPAWARILGDPFLRQLTCRYKLAMVCYSFSSTTMFTLMTSSF